MQDYLCVGPGCLCPVRSHLYASAHFLPLGGGLPVPCAFCSHPSIFGCCPGQSPITSSQVQQMWVSGDLDSLESAAYIWTCPHSLTRLQASVFLSLSGCGCLSWDYRGRGASFYSLHGLVPARPHAVSWGSASCLNTRHPPEGAVIGVRPKCLTQQPQGGGNRRFLV